MIEVIMPKMGDGMEEGTLLEWLKQEGDSVKSNEIIGNIQTDKATLELTSPGSGKLAGFLIKPGDTVPVGQPIAALLKDGEALPASWGNGASVAASAQTEAPAASASVEKALEAVASGASSAAAASGFGRVKASPLARRVAEESGVDLASIIGSGPGGRIVEKDVLDAVKTGGSSKSASKTASAPSFAPLAASAQDQKIPLNRLRKITAERTTASKQQIPHFYVTVEVDMESIFAVREAFEEQEAGKVSINDFVIRACALALREMPVVNSTYQGDHLLQFGAVNIGMAVALEDGLTVPVMHNADQMSLRQISSRSRELAAKARDNKLSMDELSNSTFSISNMGMLDVENFGAIINAPNAAIVAVGSVKKMVIPNEEDEIEIRRIMKLTGSFDHRVVDGAVGAKFMNVLKNYLESPMRILS